MAFADSSGTRDSPGSVGVHRHVSGARVARHSATVKAPRPVRVGERLGLPTRLRAGQRGEVAQVGALGPDPAALLDELVETVAQQESACVCTVAGPAHRLPAGRGHVGGDVLLAGIGEGGRRARGRGRCAATPAGPRSPWPPSCWRSRSHHDAALEPSSAPASQLDRRSGNGHAGTVRAAAAPRAGWHVAGRARAVRRGAVGRRRRPAPRAIHRRARSRSNGRLSSSSLASTTPVNGPTGSSPSDDGDGPRPVTSTAARPDSSSTAGRPNAWAAGTSGSSPWRARWAADRSTST